MKRNKKSAIAVLVALAVGVGLFAPAVFADEWVITGKLTQDGMFDSEEGGQYVLTDNDQKQKAMKHVGKTVTVTGFLKEEEGKQTMTIISFEVENGN